ncbi:hypothetical protein L2E82_29837 [Cichorium intybus]|uniref:Uncharacterized protein n=1 Tax=Cichorium intybus TaxID=13427 RepID=A0ACB9CYK5_CICIN|nr:hypothetical protein L2E82_29837 [Cichorium intybus]
MCSDEDSDNIEICPTSIFFLIFASTIGGAACGSDNFLSSFSKSMFDLIRFDEMKQHLVPSEDGGLDYMEKGVSKILDLLKICGHQITSPLAEHISEETSFYRLISNEVK